MTTYYVLGSIKGSSGFVAKMITAESPSDAISVYLSIYQEENVYAIGVYSNRQSYENAEEPLDKWMSEECVAHMNILAIKYGDL